MNKRIDEEGDFMEEKKDPGSPRSHCVTPHASWGGVLLIHQHIRSGPTDVPAGTQEALQTL